MSLFSCSLTAIFALLLVGCLNTSGADALPVRTLAKGAFSGIGDARQEVVKDPVVWENMWAKHTSGSKPSERQPEVDFAKEMVVMVTMGRQRSGGYSIEVTKVEPAREELRITIVRKTPPPDAMTIQALTAPFHFVAVPKSNLKPVFRTTAPSEKP